MEENFWGKIIQQAMGASDGYILIFAVLSLVFLMTSLWLSRMR